MTVNGVPSKYELWKKNWVKEFPVRPTFPYGEVPIAECVKRIAEKTPDRVAAIFYGREVTFREWDESSDKLATALADMGYQKGDRVLLYLHNSPQIFIAYIAATRLGMIVFTADPGFKQFELEYEIEDSGAKLVFGLDQNYKHIEEIRKKNRIKNVILTRDKRRKSEWSERKDLQQYLF